MSWDLMSYLSRALSWAGGTDVGRNTHVEGGAAAGAGALTGTAPPAANELLGGMVGGFGGPMAWKGAGFGAAAQGQVSNRSGDFAGGNAGLGFGAGYSSWSMMDDGYKKTGYSGASGGVAPVGFSAGTPNMQLGGSTNFYSGVGGSAYSFDNGSDRGYGAKGTAVPLGAADTNFGFNSKYGSYNAHADNAYLGKTSGAASFGKDGSWYHGDMSGGVSSGVDGLNTKTTTPIGTFTSSAGNINYGTSGYAGGEFNSKTGDGSFKAGFSDGLGAKNVDVGYSNRYGSADVGAGNIFYGNKADGTASFDAGSGTFKANASGDFMGVQVDKAHAAADFGKYGNAGATLGSFSNTTQIRDASFTANKDGFQAGLGSADGMGMRFKDFDAHTQLGSGPNAVKASAGFDELSSTNSIGGAYLGANWKDPSDPSLSAGFKSLSYGPWSGKNLHADVNGPWGANMHAGVKDFTMGLNASDFDTKIDKTGINANLGHADYSDFTINKAALHSGIDLPYVGAVSSDLRADQIASDKLEVDKAHIDSSWDPRKGVHASVGSAQYDEVYLKGVNADQKFGDLYNSHLGLDEGTFNHAAAKKVYADADLTNGIGAGLEDGHYSFLGGKGIDIRQQALGGNLGFGVHAGEAKLGGVDVGKVDFHSTLRDTHANVDDLEAYGWKAKNQRVEANVGKLGGNIGAGSVDLADLKVGNAKLDSSNFGTTGSASLDKARLDAINIKGGNAGLSWGGKEMLGFGTDVNLGGGVDHAQANWDLFGSGTAGGSFKNASIGGGLTNTHVNLFGHNFAIPDMAAKLNASGGANLDLMHGAADANLSLAGSSLNFAGHKFVMPEWAQAGAGVNLSQGAANFNLGGKNGVGADLNIAKGQFGIDAFGHHLDVAQGVRDIGSGISSAASTVGSGLSSAAHSVGNFVSHLW